MKSDGRISKVYEVRSAQRKIEISGAIMQCSQRVPTKAETETMADKKQLKCKAGSLERTNVIYNEIL